MCAMGAGCGVMRPDTLRVCRWNVVLRWGVGNYNRKPDYVWNEDIFLQLCLLDNGREEVGQRGVLHSEGDDD